MKKSVKLLLLSLPFILIVFGYLCFYSFARIPKAIATDMWAIKFPDKYEEYTTIKCDLFDLTSPEYVFVDQMPERDLELMFYNVKSKNLFSKKIKLEYTGGTDIKNTTFPELVRMVKEDCGQFQQAKGDFRDTTINWSYGKYEPEPEKTPEDIEWERIKAIYDEAEDIRLIMNELMSDAQRQEARANYGDWELMQDDELIQWYKNGPGRH